MIAFAVLSATGATLAVFRDERDANVFAEMRTEDPAPIFRAETVQAITMDEGIWDQRHKPLIDTPYLQHFWGEITRTFKRSSRED